MAKEKKGVMYQRVAEFLAAHGSYEIAEGEVFAPCAFEQHFNSVRKELGMKGKIAVIADGMITIRDATGDLKRTGTVTREEISAGQYVTIAEASRIIGITKQTLRNWIHSGRIPCDFTATGVAALTPEIVQKFSRKSRKYARPTSTGSVVFISADVDVRKSPVEISDQSRRHMISCVGGYHIRSDNFYYCLAQAVSRAVEERLSLLLIDKFTADSIGHESVKTLRGMLSQWGCALEVWL